jgi:hypothetical protein
VAVGGKGGGGGGASSSIDVKVEPSTTTVDVVGLDDIDVTSHWPDQLRTKAETTSTATSTSTAKSDLTNDTHLRVDPLKTDSSLSLDVKPAVVDLCVTANIGKVPNLCIRQPYQHRIGMTLYGVELWGITFSGEQQMVAEELDRQAHVVWGGTGVAWPPPPREPPPRAPTRDAGGLRIRLGP